MQVAFMHTMIVVLFVWNFRFESGRYHIWHRGERKHGADDGLARSVVQRRRCFSEGAGEGEDSSGVQPRHAKAPCRKLEVYNCRDLLAEARNKGWIEIMKHHHGLTAWTEEHATSASPRLVRAFC